MEKLTMTKMFIITISLFLLLSSLTIHAVPIGGPAPKLKKLIDLADAIVILRIDQHLSDFGSPSFYSIHKCFIYQTIKGNIPKNIRIKLQLMNTKGSFATPYAHGSTHLMFLIKKTSKDESTNYRTLTFNGAQILLSPLGHEKAPKGKTINQKVRNVIKDAITYQNNKNDKNQIFLQAILEK